MRKKIVREIIPKENLLGCESKLDLYDKLFEKSILVFPEYEVRARKGISKHTANLILAGVYSNGRLIELSYNSNVRLAKHLEKLAQKGFAYYAKKQHKGLFKLNIEKIKSGWLKLDHQKTNDEFNREAIDRINLATKRIVRMAQKYNPCEIALQIEFLQAVLEELAEDNAKSMIKL